MVNLETPGRELPLAVPGNHIGGSSFRAHLERAAEYLDTHPIPLLGLLTVAYAFLVSIDIGKSLWFDELFTYYIAKQPTIHDLLDANRHTDLIPPLLYFLVRLSHALFGTGEIATRLPTVVGFWAGSVGVFAWLAKRTGNLVAAGALAVFWGGFFLLYASDARPYGIWVGFFGIALYCWDSIAESKRPWLPLLGLWLSTFAMMLSHVLAPLSIAVLCAGELVIALETRQIRWLVWGAFLLPVTLEISYVTWMRTFEQIIFPAVYQAGPLRLIRFFGRLAYEAAVPLAAGLAVGLAFTRWDRRPEWVYRFRRTDMAVLIAMFAMPFLMVAALARSHGAFHFRYAITGSLVFWIAASLFANYLFRNTKLAAALFAATVLLAAYGRTQYKRSEFRCVPGATRTLTELKPELPMVSGSGLTFLEMDHYETPQLKKRLFYLTDREYATKYAHATLWEGYRGLKQYFPIQGTITAYRAFIEQHPHFVVLGDKDYLEDWLLRRLFDDPAMTVKPLGKIECCYKDKELYEITRSSVPGRR